jgi:hypothetical protein
MPIIGKKGWQIAGDRNSREFREWRELLAMKQWCFA